MKRAFISAAIIACVALSLPAHADNRLDFCKKLSETAGEIVQLRYDGKPMADLIKAVQQIEIPSMRKYAEFLIETAYSLPDYRTKQEQQHVKTEFQNGFFVSCYTGHVQ